MRKLGFVEDMSTGVEVARETLRNFAFEYVFRNPYSFQVPGEIGIYSERRSLVMDLPRLFLAVMVFIACVIAVAATDFLEWVFALIAVGALFAFGWMLIEWFVTRVFISDRRMYEITGFVKIKVAVIPLGKLTDMVYRQSLTGRFFRYGEVVVETAGQDQALTDIKFLRRPEVFYKVATALAIGVKWEKVTSVLELTPDIPLDQAVADRKAASRTRFEREVELAEAEAARYRGEFERLSAEYERRAAEGEYDAALGGDAAMIDHEVRMQREGNEQSRLNRERMARRSIQDRERIRRERMRMEKLGVAEIEESLDPADELRRRGAEAQLAELEHQAALAERHLEAADWSIAVDELRLARELRERSVATDRHRVEHEVAPDAEIAAWAQNRSKGKRREAELADESAVRERRQGRSIADDAKEAEEAWHRRS